MKIVLLLVFRKSHLYINISIFETLEGHGEIPEAAKKSSSRMFLMQGYNSISFKL